MTSQTIEVVGVLLDQPGLSGADICRATGLASGTLYPILLRLESAGFLESWWERGRASDLGRPRRRFYKVSAEGARAVFESARRVPPAIARMALS